MGKSSSFRKVGSKTPEPVRLKKRILLVQIAAILILGVLIYSNTFHSEFLFDDLRQLFENYEIRRLSNLHLIWQNLSTRFLTYLTFALNYQIHRMDVFGYHLVNLAIHLGAGLLVFALTRLTFQTPKMKDHFLRSQADSIAFFAALLFLAHPIQTAAVTYIVQRLAELATLFYAGALVLYAHARLTGKLRYHLAAWWVTVAAMFTKEISFTLPLAIALYEFIFFTGFSKKGARRLGKLIPYLAALVIVPAFYSRGAGIGLDQLLAGEGAKVSATVSRGEYFFTQFNVLCTYLRLLFFPVAQNADYDYPLSKNFWDGTTPFAFLLLVLLFGFAVWLCRRERWIAFGIFWFFLTLSVESSLIPIQDVIFEHRLYLPMVGFAMVVPFVFYRVAANSGMVRWLLWAIVLIFSMATYRRNDVWRDGIRFWTDVAHKSPHKERAYRNLAFHYNARGEYDAAIQYARHALKVQPLSAGAYLSMGLAFGRQGNTDKEIAAYEQALKIGHPFPAKLYNNLGSAYGRKGNFEKAVEYLEKGIAADPGYPPNYVNLGFSYDQMGQYDKALEYYQKGLELDPDFAEAYNFMGILYGKKGEPRKAVEYCLKAILLKPDFAEAYGNVGVGYGLMHQTDKMIEYLETAVRIKPDYAQGYLNLSKAYTLTGNTVKAEEAARKAANLAPKKRAGTV